MNKEKNIWLKIYIFESVFDFLCQDIEVIFKFL